MSLLENEISKNEIANTQVTNNLVDKNQITKNQVKSRIMDQKLHSLEDVKILKLAKHTSLAVGTSQGTLIVAEEGKNIPYSCPRIFFVLDLEPGEIRGDHAHRYCSQILICVRGEIEVKCTDGAQERIFVLNSPDQALLIPNSIWASQKYMTTESILLVLTDNHFDEKDYIRKFEDYKEFRKG